MRALKHFAVKAFRTLVSGEDAELKSAYERFHKTVEQEQDIVIKAILTGVEELKRENSAVHANIRTSLVLAERLDTHLGTAATGVRHICTYVESKVVCSAICFPALM